MEPESGPEAPGVPASTGLASRGSCFRRLGPALAGPFEGGRKVAAFAGGADLIGEAASSSGNLPGSPAQTRER